MPLTVIAARQTFIDIADEIHNNAEVDQLLDITDNVPLAIQLVATIAASEGCQTTLERWKLERTALLSAGSDKRSNLEISISLSLSCPRMLSSPHAVELLSLMSLMSDGISDMDLMQSNIPIPDIPECKTTLIRTSLAYVDHLGRFKVLNLIREYIHTTRPPTPFLVRPLQKHLNELLKLWRTVMNHSAFVADITPRLVSNLGNLHNVLLHGLDSDFAHLGEIMRGIIILNDLCLMMGRGLMPLMLRVPEMLAGMEDHELHALFLIGALQAWQFYTVPNLDKSIDEAIKHLCTIKNLRGEGEYHCL
jgi:hypothetical protein